MPARPVNHRLFYQSIRVEFHLRYRLVPATLCPRVSLVGMAQCPATATIHSESYSDSSPSPQPPRHVGKTIPMARQKFGPRPALAAAKIEIDSQSPIAQRAYCGKCKQRFGFTGDQAGAVVECPHCGQFNRLRQHVPVTAKPTSRPLTESPRSGSGPLDDILRVPLPDDDFTAFFHVRKIFVLVYGSVLLCITLLMAFFLLPPDTSSDLRMEFFAGGLQFTLLLLIMYSWAWHRRLRWLWHIRPLIKLWSIVGVLSIASVPIDITCLIHGDPSSDQAGFGVTHLIGTVIIAPVVFILIDMGWRSELTRRPHAT